METTSLAGDGATATIGAVALRHATDADLAAVQALAALVWRAHYPAIIGASQVEYMLARGYALPVLAQMAAGPGSGIELAVVGEDLVGFAGWYMTDDPGLAKLDRVYVRPDRQRQGVGGTLMARVRELAHAAGASRITLNVNKHNVQAQRAYEKHGFVRRAAVVIDIGAGFVMDDYVMERHA